MADAEAQVPEEVKKKSPMVMIIAAVVVLAGGGGAAFFMLSGAEEAAAAEAPDSGEKLGKLIQLESFIVNLNEAKSTRYLKISFSAELNKPSAEERLKERKDVVRDRVLTYLSGLGVNDVRGSEPKEIIREGLVERINEAIRMEEGVRNVLYTEFVVQ
ncbi:MAG: flagellar FliL protein [Myxococcota bacterium]|jgi:flagellar FliL protein